MREPAFTGKTAAKEVRAKLRILNALTTLVVSTLFLVILRYVYGPVARYLDFLPDFSVALIMAIVAVLTVASIAFSMVFSRQVVSSIEGYSRNLDSVLNVTREIREETYGDILLDKILGHSLALTGSEAGLILLREGEGLVIKAAKGASAPGLAGRSIPREKGVAGWVLAEGKPLVVHDLGKDSRFDPRLYDLEGFEARSVLCVPMKARGRTVGAIEMLNRHNGRYSERDVELVGYLADQAAISVERAKFYEDQRNYEIHLTDIMLDSIDRFVSEKRGHSKRVARYAAIIARSIKMPDERARRLYYASLLHDIGFIKIPLEKFGDKSLYRQHPGIGYEMLSPINFYKDIAPFVLHHHERYDGKGYPAGLAGNRIPLESRIIFIAEAFDAMVSDKSYRPPRTFEAAVEELKKNAGTQFDATLVEHFVGNVTQAAVE